MYFDIPSLTPVWTHAGMLLRHARYKFLMECVPPGEKGKKGGEKKGEVLTLIREQMKDTIIIFIGGSGDDAGSGRAGRNVDVRYIYFGRNTTAMMSSSIFERLPMWLGPRDSSFGIPSESPSHLVVVVSSSRRRQLLSRCDVRREIRLISKKEDILADFLHKKYSTFSSLHKLCS